MNRADALQAAAVLLLLYGSWEAGNQRIRAFAAKLLSSAAQIVIGLSLGVWGNVAIGLILVVLQSRAIYIWHKKGATW
jgi:hypothetical protein